MEVRVRERCKAHRAGGNLRRFRRHSVDDKASIKKPTEPDFTVEEED
jgi:cyclic nucleotide gated channel, plant